MQRCARRSPPDVRSGPTGSTIAPAWTGGRNGTLSEQRTTAGPGWASLLTGTWANRHGVRWDTADQRIDASAPTLALAHARNPSAKASALTSASLYPDAALGRRAEWRARNCSPSTAPATMPA